MSSREWILWIDCLGGLIVGVVVLLAHQFLSRIEGLPTAVILFMGLANLAYGSYSLLVTTRKPRSLKWIQGLAVANMAWLPVCVGIFLTWLDTLTIIGVLLVVGEGLYVAGLGVLEWRWRTDLASIRN